MWCRFNRANIRQIGLFLWVAAFLLSGKLPARAVDVSFDSSNFTQVLGEVHKNTSPASNINVLAPSNGFGTGTKGFFDSQFLLLGAKPSDSNIPSDSLKFGASTTLSDSFTISADDASQDIIVKFDWAFQGNATGFLNDLDTFAIVFSGIGSLNGVQVEVFNRLSSQYGSNKQESVTIGAGLLQAGDYKMGIKLVEFADLNGQSSAAGIDNVTINSVPFEFSPATGLLLVGGFWSFSYLLKHKKIVINSK